MCSYVLFDSLAFLDSSVLLDSLVLLIVVGGNSSSKGCGFETLHFTLDGHFSHLFVVMFVWKDENKQKEAGDGPFKKLS